MKIRLLSFFLALVISLGLLFSGASASETTPKPMRGVWVASVYQIDFPKEPTADATSLQKQADAVLARCEALGFTDLFLQVRPSSDALYPSAFAPYSRFLTGKVGKAPSDGFDPLGYILRKATSKGIKVHAWLNPYRITTNKQKEWDALPQTAPAKQHPEAVLQWNGNYYWNPAEPFSRELLVQTVRELIEHYPALAGVHLDDYFYPNPNVDDSASYAKYNTGAQPLADFRRDQVTMLIRSLHRTVQEASGGRMVFGVSPSGVWENKKDHPQGSDTQGGNPSYSKAYADTLAWVKEGIVDYIAPQLYWYLGFPAADYQVLARWWAKAVEGTPVRLYIGEAAYKVGDPKGVPAWKQEGEMTRHFALGQTIPNLGGYIFFSLSSFAPGGLAEKELLAWETQTIPPTGEVPPIPDPTYPKPDKPFQIENLSSYAMTAFLILLEVMAR